MTMIFIPTGSNFFKDKISRRKALIIHLRNASSSVVQKGSDGEYHNMPFDSVIGGEQFYDLLTVGLRISQSQVDLVTIFQHVKEF